MNTLIRSFLATLMLTLALPAAAGERHGNRGWGKGWGHDNRHHDNRHHGYRHGGHYRGRGHGDNFNLRLGFVFPPYYGSTRSYSRGYYGSSGYYGPPPRTVVIERSAPVVVYRQAPNPVYYGSQSRPSTPPGCREFNTRVVIGGRLQNAWGNACPGPDGGWRVVD